MASSDALTLLAQRAEEYARRFEELSLQRCDGALSAQVGPAEVTAEVRDFHALCQELQKGEKSALAVRGK